MSRGEEDSFCAGIADRPFGAGTLCCLLSNRQGRGAMQRRRMDERQQRTAVGSILACIVDPSLPCRKDCAAPSSRRQANLRSRLLKRSRCRSWLRRPSSAGGSPGGASLLGSKSRISGSSPSAAILPLAAPRGTPTLTILKYLPYRQSSLSACRFGAGGASAAGACDAGAWAGGTGTAAWAAGSGGVSACAAGSTGFAAG